MPFASGRRVGDVKPHLHWICIVLKSLPAGHPGLTTLPVPLSKNQQHLALFQLYTNQFRSKTSVRVQGERSLAVPISDRHRGLSTLVVLASMRCWGLGQEMFVRNYMGWSCVLVIFLCAGVTFSLGKSVRLRVSTINHLQLDSCDAVT